MDEKFENVDLLRPLLPEAKHIMPYLERIDKSRWYSNFGPLEQELEERMCDYFSMPPESVVTASSATAGIISVLRGLNLQKDSFCLLPSWTFVADPASAIAAEMTPYFIDVDDKTWALDPEQVKKDIQKIKGVIGAVIVVAPFGKLVDIQAWDKFTRDTSIPVVIDAASGFDSFRNAKFGKTAVVFSLHATKILGAGEGGLVVSTDKALLRHVREQTNFGFYTRLISIPGINSKMSEYSAAVAHASLDTWPERRKAWRKKIELYASLLEPLVKKHGIAHYFDGENVTTTCNIRLPQNAADQVISQLQVRGIKARQWWDKGCHRQPAYGKYPRLDLGVTENLAQSVVSLPFYVDIPDAHLAYVAAHLEKILDHKS